MKDWWGVAACKHVARKIHDLIAPIALDTHERLKNYMLVMPYEYIDNLDRYSAILRDVKPPVHAGDGDAFAGYFQGVPTDAAKWLPPVIAFVQGNNDPSFASADFNETITVPSKVLLKAGNRNILVSHGHNESVYYDISTLEQCAATYNANTVLYGHTHVPFEILTRKAYIMNPGSIGYPRNHSKPGFAILEISEKAVYSIFYKIEFDPDIHFTPYHPEIFY